MVTHAAHPRAAVLVDSLHLARTGGQPADLLRIPLGLLPYIQVCDAGSAAVSDDEPAYMAEARGGRLLPGHGCLPLELLVTTFRARPGGDGCQCRGHLRGPGPAVLAPGTRAPGVRRRGAITARWRRPLGRSLRAKFRDEHAEQDGCSADQLGDRWQLVSEPATAWRSLPPL